jgi:cellulose synthase/poly-beta-1,6-N-acetylglucosamine synthase-like glycosyltransferase
MSRGRYGLGAAVVLAVLVLGAASLAADVAAVGPPLSLVLLVLDVRVLLGLAATALGLGFLLYAYYLHAEDPSRLVDAGRDVEALVPVYEDTGVMHRSVEGLLASDYEDLTVTVVCEPDDAATVRRARELAGTHEDVRYLINEARRGSKAGALNVAVERSDADVLALFDADQEPHPRLVSHAVAALETHDVARVRSLPRPSGRIESEAYYEYLLLFFLPQKLGKALLGLEVVGTRSVLIERAVFERVGLFDEETLTEDMEFTHRCHQAGMAVRELLYYPAFEQPAHTLRDWWWQRVRWMTGHAEVGHVQLRRWRGQFDRDVLGSLLTLVGTFAAGVVMSTTVPKLALAALSDPLAVVAGLCGLYAVALATRAVDNRSAGLTGYGWAWLLLPVFLSLYGLVIVQALASYALGWDGEWYRADKQP